MASMNLKIIDHPSQRVIQAANDDHKHWAVILNPVYLEFAILSDAELGSDHERRALVSVVMPNRTFLNLLDYATDRGSASYTVEYFGCQRVVSVHKNKTVLSLAYGRVDKDGDTDDETITTEVADAEILLKPQELKELIAEFMSVTQGGEPIAVELDSGPGQLALDVASGLLATDAELASLWRGADGVPVGIARFRCAPEDKARAQIQVLQELARHARQQPEVARFLGKTLLCDSQTLPGIFEGAAGNLRAFADRSAEGSYAADPEVRYE